MALVLPDLFNGPIAVGIAASTDVMHRLEQKLAFEVGIASDAAARAFAVRRIQVAAGWAPEVKGFLVKAAIFVISKDIVDQDGGARTNAGAGLAAANTDGDIQAWLAAAPEDTRVVTLLLATKVTFVMLNHHVGTNAAQVEGYAGKVLRAWEMQGLAGMREALWMAGHWMNTRQALHELGYPGLQLVRAQTLGIEVQDDMRLRITGGVAGTAKTLVYLAAYEMLIRTAYIYVVIMITDIDELRAAAAAIHAEPMEYHMGSQYLTGHPRKVAPALPDEDMSALASWLHAVIPNHTVSKSPTIMSSDEVAPTDTTAACRALKLAMAKTTDSEVALRLARSKGASVDCLAVKMGKITAEEIEAMQAEVDKERKAASEAKTRATGV